MRANYNQKYVGGKGTGPNLSTGDFLKVRRGVAVGVAADTLCGWQWYVRVRDGCEEFGSAMAQAWPREPGLDGKMNSDFCS